MSIVIQPADVHNASAVAELIWQTHASQVESTKVAQALREDEHVTHVALSQDQVVGFVDGFLTLDQQGHQRWELDLIGVNPAHQVHGIGRRLVESSVQAGAKVGAHVVRALVATDNHAMQRVLARCAFAQQAPVMSLFVHSDGVRDACSQPTDTYLIPVTTLTYRGIWLEGHITQSGIACGLQAVAHHNLDLVGAVVNSQERDVVALLQTEGFARLGQYHWWHKMLR